VLGLTPLAMADWGLVLGGATLPLLVGEMARRGRAIDTRTEALPSQGGRDGSDQETDTEGTGARAEPTR
jgi:hypothetical protein